MNKTTQQAMITGILSLILLEVGYRYLLIQSNLLAVLFLLAVICISGYRFYKIFNEELCRTEKPSNRLP